MHLVSCSSHIYQLTPLSYAVTYDVTILWLVSHICNSVMVMWYFPMFHPSNKEKKY